MTNTPAPVAVTVPHAALSDALTYLAAGAPKRATRGILTGAVLTVDSDGTVTGTTFDAYEQARIVRIYAADGAPLTPGRVWLPVHNVAAMVGKWRGMGDRVTVASDGDTVTLTCGKGRMTVRTLDAADMPALPDMPPTVGTSDARTFADVAARVTRTAGTDTLLPLFTYVHMVTDGGAFRLSATDRYRYGFGVAPRTLPGADVEPVLVPAVPLAGMAAWIAKHPADVVTIGVQAPVQNAGPVVTFTAGWGAITAGTYTMIVRLGEGDFPNIGALLPDTYAATADVPNVKTLIAAVDRVTTGAAKGAAVLLTFSADGATVECGGDGERSAETVDALTWDGTPGAATLVNSAYLVAALKACEPGAHLLFTTSRKPFVVAPAGGVNVGTLVMPIRREGHTDAPMGDNTINNPLKGDPTMSAPTPARKTSTSTRKTAARKTTASKTTTAVPAVEPAPWVRNDTAERAAAAAFAAYAAGNYTAARQSVADIVTAAGAEYLAAGKRPVPAILAAIDDAERKAAQSVDTAPAATAVDATAAPVDAPASDDQDAPAAAATAADAEALNAAADRATVAVLTNAAATAPAVGGARVDTDATGGAVSIAWTLDRWNAGTPGYKARRAAVRKALNAAGYRVHADGGASGRECIITMDGGIPAGVVYAVVAIVEPMLRTLATTGA